MGVSKLAKVTVLMPVLRGIEYLEETLQSVQGQTVADWELRVVYASDLDAENLETLQGYADKDSRIMLQMSDGWGNQAEMMNLGFENAQGEYIARAEVGAVFAADRLEKQLAFLEAHPEVSFCSSSVNMVNNEGSSSLLKAICDEAGLRASMIFGCEINHQSVMLRKADFDNKNLLYDPKWLSEYELWGRAMLEGLLMANLPEALVSCYAQSNGMDMGTRERLHAETRQLVMRNVSALGIDIADYSPTLFAGWRNRPEGFAKKHPVNFLKRGYLLLQEMAEANKEKKMFDEPALEKVLFKRWDWIRKSCGLEFVAGQYGKFAEAKAPKVSVIMPVGKCAGTLSRAIDSMQAQTFGEWELLLMQVAGQEDGSGEIAAMYAKNDARISYLPMEEERTETEAINAGVGMASGQYIARMEADVVSVPERLEKQVAYMDEHEEVVICGGWQRINDAHGERIQKIVEDNDILKARLIFYGDMLPATLMLRKKLFEDGLAYDTEAQDMDYGFLARASLCGEVANLPLVLVAREGGSATKKNLAMAAEESGKIAAQVLEQALGVSVSPSSQKLLNDWVNPLGKAQDWKREQEISRLSSILQDIWRANDEKQYYAPMALLDVLSRKWCQVRHDVNWQDLDTSRIETLEDIFAEDFKPELTMPYHIFRKEKEAGERRIPKVTALMPLFNGKKYIRESIESIQAQTFTDWEFYIVNDFGSDDGCAEIIMDYALQDERIVLVQAERRLGLAASLNLGLDLIESEYVARVDVDDPSEPERFAKEVAYLNENLHVSLVSCWQWSLTTNRSCVQEVATEPEELKAAMIFGCEISHCGVMIRKADFDAHGWRYDHAYLSEDYELWTRAMMEGAVMANLPEPLVTHRWGFGNISIDKGARLRNEVRMLSMRMLSNIGVNVDKYDRALFANWRNLQQGYFSKRKAFFLKQGYGLLREIESRNNARRFFQPKALGKVLNQRWDWIRKSCRLEFTENITLNVDANNDKPVVSAILPTFRNVEDICKIIDSIQAQTFGAWELLVVNDFGSDDGTVELVSMYALNDRRIRLIQAEKSLGLSESLNLGIRKARGKYIARCDVNGTYVLERFAKQVAFLEASPKVGVVGGWQNHYGKSEWIEETATNPELLRCRMIFWCDLCTSTLMYRRDVLLENNLFYDSHVQAEEWDLWAKAISFMDIANIPEVLVNYNDNNAIKSEAIADLAEESGHITAKILKSTLDIRLSLYDYHLLNGWRNPITNNNQEDELPRVQEIMRKIWERNEDVGFFHPKYLLQALAGKYFWLKENKNWKKEDYTYIRSLSDIFYQGIITKHEKESLPYWADKFSEELEKRIERKIEQWTWERYKRIQKDLVPEIKKSIEQWTWERYKRMEQRMVPALSKNVEKWTWERYQRSRIDLKGRTALIPYYPELGIRVVFLLQVASFWPAQEPLYRAISADPRFHVQLVCYDEKIDRSIKVETSREYLDEMGYEYIPWEEFDIDDFNPHVVFLQTAYDSNRGEKFKSKNLNLKGYRVVYIPYGIEIADTRVARHDHFENPIIEFAWKVFTFSNTMRRDYLCHIHHRTDIVALGLPRFDALWDKSKFPMHSEVLNRASGRKIVLWKVHFPKVIKEDGKVILVTPDIQEYIEFAKKLESEYADLFFVFMPHPRFYEFNDDEKVRDDICELMGILSEKDNVYIDEADDYRPSLLNSDAIIVDRSAVMIEAAVVDVPLLYMSNADFYEPMTEAVRPLVESYEQGTNCQDMVEFMERFRQGIDKNKEQRNLAFKQCIPYFDGKCSERIKEDIVASLEKESAELDRQK
ncbi:Glycosyltransferase involved in cell wall bisynthesis [Selenomonas sp. KH1T6]|nr:Glycosyltransferase involved in cell wall bisynthesis [Selenomonas ruminantium]